MTPEPARAVATATPAPDPAAEILGSYDVAEAEARAVMQLQRYEAALDSIDARTVGTWFGLPPGMERWSFVRLGKRNSEAAQRLAGELRQFGFQLAPSSVRCVGFEREDPRDAIYMCAPPAVQAAREAAKKKIRERKAQILRGSFESEVSRISGAEITHGEDRRMSGSDLISRWGKPQRG